MAFRAKRSVVPGTVMGVGSSLPHDVTQYVIEAATGYTHGFWGLLSVGATYKSTGRKVTKPGRAVIVAHRRELVGAEVLAGQHFQQCAAGRRTPVTQALETALEQWRQLTLTDRLVFDWPPPEGRVVAAVRR